MSAPTLRVVLAPRAGVDARSLLDEAAVLARALDAELEAVLVEEADLLRCVALPVTVEIGLVSGAVHPADPEATRRVLARRAEQLRVLVAQTAAALDLPWSFVVTRGDLVREALAAAVAAPVLLAPPRSAVQHAVGPRPGARSRSTVAVLDDPATTRRVAAEPDDIPTSADRAWAAAVRFAGGRTEAIARTALADLVRGPTPRVLVVSLASVAGRPGLLEQVLAAAGCPIVLVA